MEEIWKDIDGYEGIYQVSNMGQVKSFKFGKERILKPHAVGPKKYQHYQVSLRKDGKTECMFIHGLVMNAFEKKPDDRMEIDHIDRNPRNNRLDNLRYVFHKENVDNGVSKKVYCAELERTFNSASDAARFIGVSHAAISQCCTGKCKMVKGYHFTFANLESINRIKQVTLDVHNAIKEARFSILKPSHEFKSSFNIEIDKNSFNVDYSVTVLGDGTIELSFNNYRHIFATVDAFIDKLKTIDLCYKMRKELEQNNLM